MKQVFRTASIGITLGVLASLAAGQDTRVYREGSNWVQEITGSFAGAKTLHVKVDMGSVRVEGGSQSGISYEVRTRAYSYSLYA